MCIAQSSSYANNSTETTGTRSSCNTYVLRNLNEHDAWCVVVKGCQKHAQTQFQAAEQRGTKLVLVVAQRTRVVPYSSLHVGCYSRCMYVESYIPCQYRPDHLEYLLLG